MKKRVRRGLSLLLALCVLMSAFTGTAFAVTGTAAKQVTFQQGFTERGSISGTGFNAMANVPREGTAAHEPYLPFYNWKAATGVFGKSADDIALQFISHWENQVNQDGTPLEIPGSKVISGWEWPTNPWTQHNIGVKELSETDRVHISFEYAREGGASGAYMQFQTYTNKGGSTKKQDNSMFGLSTNDVTGETVSIFGEKVKLDFGTWHQFDYIIYPKYNTAAEGETPAYSVVADLYFDGKLLKEKKVIYSGDYLTGIEGVRLTFDPRKVSGVYPLTNTYVDNFSHKVFTASDTAPVITKTALSHSDTTLNAYIDNDNRRIDYHGQTVGEMLTGLNVPTGSTVKAVDKSGKELDSAADFVECYLQIAKNYGEAYYGGYDYYTVRNMKRLLTGSSLVDIDFDTNSIPNVYLYTSVGALIDSLTLEEGASAKIVDASNNEISRGEDIGAGMKILVTKEAVSETYTFGTVHDRAVDLDFDGWNNKYYYGSPTNNYKGTSFGGSAFKDDAGVKPEDVAYVEYVEEPGRGNVMHVYSNSDYTKDYNHMNIFCSTPSSAQLGKKFVMEMSAKIGVGSSIQSQVKYITKTNSTPNFLNPIVFTENQIKVMNTIVKQDCKQGNWYDVKAYCDTDSGLMVVFIDGEEIYRGTNETVKAFKAFTDTRIIQHYCTKDQVRESWVDDFRIYGVGGLTDSFLATMDTKLTSEVLTVEGASVSGYAGMTAQQLLDAVAVSSGASKKVLTPDGKSEVGSGTLAEKGMIIQVTSPDGSSRKNYVLDIADAVIGDIQYKSNGVMTNGKFAVGTFEASVEVDSYVTSGIPLALVVAQYENDRLINISVEEANITQKGISKLTATMNVTKSEGTTMSIMLLDGLATIRPLKKSIKLTPFSSAAIETVTKLYPGYVNKAVTLSFDDLNPVQDGKFIEILNKNGLKATFNLKTSNFIKQSESVQQSYVKMYQGHELANHTRNHLRLYETNTESTDYQTLQTCKDEILNGQNDIKSRFGVTPEGLVWPFTSPRNRTDYAELIEYIRSLGIKYIRPVDTTNGFNLPSDWYDWRASCHHDGANNLVDRFLALPDEGGEVDDLKLFYIWGHTYEFDETHKPEETNKLRWDDIEALCKKLGDANIWSATNLEVYNYVEALKKIEIDTSTNRVTNPTDVDVYIQINGINTMVPAHGVAGL